VIDYTMVDAAFQGIGQSEGMNLFRIEQGEVVEQPAVFNLIFHIFQYD